MPPQVMFFDKLTSALDPELICEVLAVMEKLVADGMTMLIVTHEMNFARQFAHRIIYMDEGVFVESGPRHNFLKTPRLNKHAPS